MRVEFVPHFADHFSETARSYAAFRPSYPVALIDHLAMLAPARELAWDCGTGSGQAAVLLAERFTRVVATDASKEQLAHAVVHPRVVYRVALEGDSGLPGASTDLVTAAQALHWFDLRRFFDEARRVMKPNGVFAAWSYARVEVDEAVDRVLAWFYSERVGRYWPPARRMVEDGYRELELPFDELDSGTWSMESSLDRRELCGYVGTWSAVKECRSREGRDPIAELDLLLAAAWPDPAEKRRARWPVALRVGRRHDGGTPRVREVECA